ncbi:MAG TPA: hypothetical protein V6C58_02395 [Allocoleopsis sp.]
MFLNNFDNCQDKTEWIKQMKKYMKEFKLDEISAIVDTKRFLKNSEKNEVWCNSSTHYLFDPKYFRKDILGFIAIKNLNCPKYENEHKFKLTYDFEHFISYSHGGSTTIENSCILNRGINRSKGCEELFILDFYRKEYLIYKNCISFEELLQELNADLHETCKKYDLTFSKTFEGIWTIKSFTYKNDYYQTIKYRKIQYIDEDTNGIRENHVIEIDVSETTKKIIKIVGAVLVSGITVYIGYKIYRYFYPKNKK